MAWTEKLKTGYRGRYRNPLDTREKIKVVKPDGTLFERKRDAKEAAQEEESTARRNALAGSGSTQLASITWGEWWDQVKAKRDFDSETPRVEANVVKNHLRPKWGDLPLNKITREAVQRWVSEEELRVRPGMSPSYARRIYALFSATITKAAKEKVLNASPCVGIDLPKIPKRRRAYLAPDTAEKLPLNPAYKDLVSFGLETGLRPGELAGLHACSVDLVRGWVEVTDVYVPRRKFIRPEPKDEDARSVPLTPVAEAIVRRRLADRDLNAGCGLPHTDGSVCRSPLVFLSPRGKPVIPDRLGEAMRYAAGKINVPARGPYTIRRGFATRAAEGGYDAFALAETMGHSDMKITQGYVQQTPAAAARLIAALSPPDEPRGAPRGADSDRHDAQDLSD